MDAYCCHINAFQPHLFYNLWQHLRRAVLVWYWEPVPPRKIVFVDNWDLAKQIQVNETKINDQIVHDTKTKNSHSEDDKYKW
jgi:hypothetical protein